jgi:hypothetical protein
LAHHLQRLIWIGALGAVASAAAAAPPFSHKLHLELGLDCLKCHSGVMASVKATDNNLPGQAVCAACHRAPGEMTVKPEPRATRLAFFNHQLHLKFGSAAPVIAGAIAGKSYHTSSPGSLPLERIRAYLGSAGNNACAACHRGVEDSEATSHSLFPQMADCLVCHPKIENPFSCEKCHQAGEHLKPASHTATYADFHSSGKANLDKQSCVICHGRRFQCLGCH